MLDVEAMEDVGMANEAGYCACNGNRKKFSTAIEKPTLAQNSTITLSKMQGNSRAERPALLTKIEKPEKKDERDINEWKETIHWQIEVQSKNNSISGDMKKDNAQENDSLE